MLAKIHKAIIDHQFTAVEKEQGQVLAAGTRLQLLLNGHEFAWLRPLSQLMTEIDGVIFQKTPVEGAQILELKSHFYDLLIASQNPLFQPEIEKLKMTIPSLNDEIAHAVALYEQL